MLYDRLLSRIREAGGAMLSIAHRPGLAALHNRQWRFEAVSEGGGAMYRVRSES